MELALGIDLGTSYFKLGLFDRKGRLRGLGRVAVETESDTDGHRQELPVERFWETLRQGLREALDAAGAGPDSINAIGYSSQASTFLLLDEHGEALTPLILWTDQRVGEIHSTIREHWGREDFLSTAGFDLLDPGLCPAKLRWFQDHEPEIWRRVHSVQTISDFLTLSLTGKRAGDQGTAVLLGLRDQRAQSWWSEGLAAAGLERSMLSDLFPPGTPIGGVTEQGASRLGLKPGVFFAVGSLDHHVAAVGAGIDHLAPISVSLGTVLAVVHTSEAYRPQPECCVGPGVAGRGHFELAWNMNGASGLEWYHRAHAPDVPFPDLLAMAAEIPPGCEGLRAKPCPADRPDLGGFEGRLPDHGHGHFVRAIMESVVHSLGDLVDHLCPDGRPESMVVTGGGARSDLWLQMAADTLGLRVIRSGSEEPACLGAAIFAASAVGWFDSIADARRAMVSSDREFSPA
jgi:sugar (pentulose or hexulose) kinase